MDLGLKGSVVWLAGPACALITEVAAAFLEEGALVRVLTTPQLGRTADKRLQLRSGGALRVLTLEPKVGPLSPTLLPDLLDMGPPQVLVLYRGAREDDDPSSHEWDQFLRSRSAQLNAEGAVVVLEAERRPDRPDDDLDGLILSARAQQRIWSDMTPEHCHVSLVAVSPGAVSALNRRSARAPTAPERAQGLAALTVFMASLGRGRCAVVASDGAACFV